MPAAPPLEKAGASWAPSVRATQGKENHIEQRRRESGGELLEPNHLSSFHKLETRYVKRSCALSDLQMQRMHRKPQEVFFSTEAEGFIDTLSNIQA